MTLYVGMPMLVYDMMIDKLDCGVGAMMLNMEIYMLVCGMIVLVDVRLV